MGRRKTRAVTLMLLSSLSFSIMQVFVKMSSTEVGTFEQVFFRNLISMIIAGVTVYRAKLDLIPEIELSSNELLIDLARIGLGIAFVPDYCIPENDPDLFIVHLEEQLPARQMVVAYNENIPLSQAARQFIDML